MQDWENEVRGRTQFRKTRTLRNWSDERTNAYSSAAQCGLYARLGGQAWDSIWGWAKIKKVYRQTLNQLTLEDVRREGFEGSVDSFVALPCFEGIPRDKKLTVVEFEYIELRKHPTTCWTRVPHLTPTHPYITIHVVTRTSSLHNIHTIGL